MSAFLEFLGFLGNIIGQVSLFLGLTFLFVLVIGYIAEGTGPFFVGIYEMLTKVKDEE